MSATPDTSISRPPLPPFTEETARLKVQMAEDAWNSKDPVRCSLAYTPDSWWRNRSEFLRPRSHRGFSGAQVGQGA
jgi:nuclear transport factor 2 (NTF2) superfamily protein